MPPITTGYKKIPIQVERVVCQVKQQRRETLIKSSILTVTSHIAIKINTKVTKVILTLLIESRTDSLLF